MQADGRFGRAIKGTPLSRPDLGEADGYVGFPRVNVALDAQGSDIQPTLSKS